MKSSIASLLSSMPVKASTREDDDLVKSEPISFSKIGSTGRVAPTQQQEEVSPPDYQHYDEPQIKKPPETVEQTQQSPHKHWGTYIQQQKMYFNSGASNSMVHPGTRWHTQRRGPPKTQKVNNSRNDQTYLQRTQEGQQYGSTGTSIDYTRTDPAFLQWVKNNQNNVSNSKYTDHTRTDTAYLQWVKNHQQQSANMKNIDHTRTDPAYLQWSKENQQQSENMKTIDHNRTDPAYLQWAKEYQQRSSNMQNTQHNRTDQSYLKWVKDYQEWSKKYSHQGKILTSEDFYNQSKRSRSLDEAKLRNHQITSNTPINIWPRTFTSSNQTYSEATQRYGPPNQHTRSEYSKSMHDTQLESPAQMGTRNSYSQWNGRESRESESVPSQNHLTQRRHSVDKARSTLIHTPPSGIRSEFNRLPIQNVRDMFSTPEGQFDYGQQYILLSETPNQNNQHNNEKKPCPLCPQDDQPAVVTNTQTSNYPQNSGYDYQRNSVYSHTSNNQEYYNQQQHTHSYPFAQPR